MSTTILIIFEVQGIVQQGKCHRSDNMKALCFHRIWAAVQTNQFFSLMTASEKRVRQSRTFSAGIVFPLSGTDVPLQLLSSGTLPVDCHVGKNVIHGHSFNVCSVNSSTMVDMAVTIVKELFHVSDVQTGRAVENSASECANAAGLADMGIPREHVCTRGRSRVSWRWDAS